jgi:hypothetical protein
MGRGRPGWRPVGEEMLRLDVRKLHREGWLRPGLSFTLNWSIEGNPVASIIIFTNTDSVRLMYGTKDGEHVDDLVDLDWTLCNYGGTRTWFLCPRCSRRVAVLFAGRRFWCRHCHGIAYAVENEDAMSRMLRRSNKLRERVKVRAGTAYPVTFKPKHMHQRTFDRIRWQIQGIEAGFWMAAAERFNFTV